MPEVRVDAPALLDSGQYAYVRDVDLPRGFPEQASWRPGNSLLVIGYDAMAGWTIFGAVENAPLAEGQAAAEFAVLNDERLDGMQLLLTQFDDEHSFRCAASRYAPPPPDPPVEVSVEPIA
jgi:hypothetical protein